MFRVTARLRIVLDLISILSAVVLIALTFRLVPDRSEAVIEGRKALAQAIAVASTVMLEQADYQKLNDSLEVIRKQNPDLLSAAFRDKDGTLRCEAGLHGTYWDKTLGTQSNERQFYVPIQKSASETLGGVELRFASLKVFGWTTFWTHPWTRMVGFISALAGLGFTFYLFKALDQLDPSKAAPVPSKVRSALNTFSDGLIVIDAKTQVLMANNAFEEIVGATAEELEKFKADEFSWRAMDSDSVPEVFPWEICLQTGEPLHDVLLRLRSADGRDHVFAVNCSPIGDRRGVMVTLDDITQLEEKKEELRLSKEEAEAANRAKSEFLANMSHEIRTPMNAIMGFTEILRRGMADSEQAKNEYLNTIHSSSGHLLNLINDILDLSKIEAGKLELEMASASPHRIALEVVQVMKAKADEKNIFLEYDSPGLPAEIETDPTRLRQIVMNLVSNAVKFTSTGGVKIVGRLIDSSTLCFDVTDTGIGLKPKQIEKVFDPFTQADNSVTRRFGGTGLGLSISKRFAEALGGELSATSTFGEGSTFTVRVDIGASATAEIISPEEARKSLATNEVFSSDAYNIRPSRILVVDDGDANRRLVKLILDRAGMDVTLAVNGQEAVDKFGESEFDLVLMDMQMPVMDGYTATRTLRAQGAQTPIFALTANAMSSDEEKCRAAGCSGFLTKPINMDSLLNTLREVLGVQSPDQISEKVEAKLAAAKEETQQSATSETAPAIDADENDDAAEVVSANAPTVSSASSCDNLVGSASRAAIGLHSDHPSPLDFSRTIEANTNALCHAFASGDMEGAGQRAQAIEDAASDGQLTEIALLARGIQDQVRTDQDLIQLAGYTEKLRDLVKKLSEQTTIASDSDSVAATPDLPAHQEEAAAPDAAPIFSELPMDDEAFVEIVESFVVRLREQMDEMQKLGRRGNYTELSRRAHWLKGAGGTVGFKQFTTPARSLELAADSQDPIQVENKIDELAALVARVKMPHEVNTDVAKQQPSPSKESVTERTAPQQDVDEILTNVTASVPDNPSPQMQVIANPILSTLPCDDPEFAEIVAQFITRLREKLDEMETACTQQNYVELASLAHWLKGAGGTLGFSEFGPLAKELEVAAKSGNEQETKERIAVLREHVDRVRLTDNAATV